MVRRLILRTLVVFVIFTLAGLPIVFADPTSPITVSLTDNPDPVASGSQLTYTISIVNTAGSKITNVVLSDQLNGVGGIGVPPQLVITSSRGSCTQSTTLVNCNAGTIEGGGAWTVSIRGIVTAASGTVLNNTATVSGTHTAQNFTTTVTQTTIVQGGANTPLPDLTISKTGPSSIQASSPMTYTLTVNNIGTQNATGVKVVDTVPASLTGVSASGTSLFTCSVASNTVTCIGGAVNQGSNATITINATSPAAASSITNTASVDPDNTIVEANELNNTSSLVNTQVLASTPPGQLTISVTDNPDPITPGSILTYQTLVTNSTGQRADDVVIVDGTQGLDASSVTVNQIITNGTLGNTGGCVVNASQTRCTARTLNAGGTIAVTITGTIVASAGTTIINTGTVTGNIKNTGTSATATTLTTVRPDVDLTVTASDAPDPVCASSWPGTLPAPAVCRGGLTYTFVIGNSGISPVVGNLTLRDPLPAGTHLDSFTAPAFAGCAVDTSNVFTCTGGSLGPQSLTTVTIVLVAPPGTGTINNTVYVDPNNAIFEADETNNTATASTQVITGIDLTIHKTDAAPGFDPIATSGTQTYTITVDDLGTQDATNIRVRDTLPSGTIFRDVRSDHGFTCSYSGGVVECIGGSLRGTLSEFYPFFGAPGKDTATITIRLFAQSFAGTMHNEVRVDPLGEIAEADETNNLASEDTLVQSLVSGGGAFNQLTITKTQTSPNKLNTARNAKVTWSIVVGNTGSDTAVGVTVRDFLPAGARYIEASDTTVPSRKFNCSQVSNYINCVGGEIPSGATATITLSAFAPDTPGTYVNQAVVDPDNTIPEGDELDNQAFETTIVKNAGDGAFYELTINSITQTPDKTNTARNALVTYTIIVANNGTDDVTGVRLRDTLPAGSRFIQATVFDPANQFLCSNSSGVVTCLGGQIPNHTTATITITAFAPDTPGSYINQAIVDPNNTIPEGDETNNEKQIETDVFNGGLGPYNDLQIKALVDQASTTPGGTITYTLQVWNVGAADASNVAVRDILPTGVTFVSALDASLGTPGAFICNQAGGVVTCSGATIGHNTAMGTGRSITIVVTAPQLQTSLTNVAIVDPDNTIPEGDEQNNTSSIPSTVSSAINLTITSDGPTTASQSDVTDYKIAVTNNIIGGGAGQNAIGVLVTDQLPVGLIPLGVDTGSGNNWACVVSENPINLVTCVGDLTPGQTETITFHVFITAQDGDTMDNQACVDPNNTIVESEEHDNCTDFGTLAVTPPPNSPDLLVSDQADKTSVTPGTDITYTINVSNTGTAKAASPVTVTDTLSPEVTFTNATTNNSWTCGPAVSGVVTCNDGGTGLGVGESVNITILTHVLDSASAPISNVAAAAQATCGDPGCQNETTVNPDHISNNTSSVLASVGSSGFDLAIGSVTDTPDPVSPGQGLKYTIVAVNGGTAVANNVHVEVDLPVAGVSFTGAAGSNGFTCAGPSAGKLDCSGNLPGGGNTTITVSFVELLSALPPTETLTATIDPANAFAETNEGNNTITQVTTVTSGGACSSCVDLVAAELVATPEPLHVGNTATVKFQVVNVGDMPTTLNPASDRLIRIVAVTNGALGGPTLSPSLPGFTCTVDTLLPNFADTSCKGNLGPGQGVTITMTIPGVAGSGLQIFGTADPSTIVFESNESNNTASQTVVILP